MSYRKYKQARPAGSHTVVLTNGVPVKGLHFMGEVMHCCMCHKEQKSDPKVESGWTYIEIEGRPGVHVCPDELPGPGASAHAYAAAYEKILRKIIGGEA